MPTNTQAPPPVIGYVLKMYPRFSETFVVSEILAREAAGERIVIFSLRPPTDARFHAELANVKAPVVQIPRTSTASRMWRHLQEAAEDPDLRGSLTAALPDLLESTYDEAYQAVLLAQAALEHGVTHLHAHFASVATTVARLTSLLTELPYSFTAHAKDIFHHDVVAEDLQHKLADCHHAVTISDYNLAHLQAQFPTATENLHVVRNGLNLHRFAYTPQRPHHQVPRLLAVGRLVEKKGFSLLIRAVAQLKQQGVLVHCDIAGDGPLAEDLHGQITQLGVGDQVQLLGPRTQEEVNELLGSHDVFAAPFVVGTDGNADGLPTVLLEAMARGIPCVAADVTAVGEVIRTSETGWLVPTGDVEALVSAITEAIDGTNHRQITDAARLLVEQRFDSVRQARQLAQLVHGIAPEPGDHTSSVSAEDQAKSLAGVLS